MAKSGRKAKKAKEKQNEKKIQMLIEKDNENQKQIQELTQKINVITDNASEKKIRVNISITDATHQRLKAYAKAKNSNVSKVITDWIWSTRFDK